MGTGRGSNDSVEISVVVPAYNEQDCVLEFLTRTRITLEKLTKSFEIIFAVDPGTDRTEAILEEQARNDTRVRVLVFSRRVGQPAAVLAGLDHARGKAVVVIDADLQDPPETIEALVLRWRQGAEVVYATRRTRDGETLMKRLVSSVGYRVIQSISEVPIPVDTGDFRLMDRRVVTALQTLPESHGFLRGLVALVGFRQESVQYDRKARPAGTSKYSQLTGSLRIGINGIVAFSNVPLAFATWLSGASFALGLGLLVAVLLNVLTLREALASIVTAFVGGSILFSIATLGAYVGRIYDEAKRRPRYFVDRSIN